MRTSATLSPISGYGALVGSVLLADCARGYGDARRERQRDRETKRERAERPLSTEGIGPITGPRLVWFFIYHKIRLVLAKRNGFRDRG